MSAAAIKNKRGGPKVLVRSHAALRLCSFAALLYSHQVPCLTEPSPGHRRSRNTVAQPAPSAGLITANAACQCGQHSSVCKRDSFRPASRPTESTTAAPFAHTQWKASLRPQAHRPYNTSTHAGAIVQGFGEARASSRNRGSR